VSAQSPRIVGRYAIHGEIAAGGMATVHLGRLHGPVGFTKTVAIKRLHDQFAKDEEFVDMFIDEARLAARIHHPNVVQTLDVVQAEDQLLLVMEYVHGAQLSTLTRLAKKVGKRMPPSIVSAVVAGMLRGLHAAHEATDEHGSPLNIVHRDISPHNVLVGVDGVPRVIDFGVAKAAGRLQQTAIGQLKGKVPYMAPEQVKGANVTRRTDVFAAGVVLWETLLGQRLFVADNDAAIISFILSRPIDPPSRVDFDVPAAYDAVVMRALERDPAKRFTTALEMAEALEQCGPIAAPTEVSQWVKQIAADQLSKRSSIIADVESSSALPAVSPSSARMIVTAPEPTTGRSQAASLSISPDAPEPRRRGGFLWVVFGLIAMGGAGYLLAQEIVFRQQPSPATSGKIEGVPTLPPLPSVSESVTSSASAAPSVSAAPSAAATAKWKPKLKPTATAPAATVTTTPDDCDPPYTFDANGMKKYKPHCL
jgi:serine/threonine protein kinase